MMIKDLVDSVRGLASLTKNPWTQLIVARGSVYDGSPQDHGFARGVPKECFRNALHLAAENELLYAEGFATHGKLAGFPIEHAWCVDSEGDVVDNTWNYSDAVYYGLVFRPAFAVKAAREIGYYGLGHNLWRRRGDKILKRVQKEYEHHV